MKRVKVVGIERLKFNKYIVKPSCGHSFVNDTSVTKLKEVPEYITCTRCKPSKS